MNNPQLFQIILAIPYVLFLPGLLISFIFFRDQTVDWIERLALSFALSLSIVPLVAFYISFAGVKISAISVLGECLVLNLTCLLIMVVVNWRTLVSKSKYSYYYNKSDTQLEPMKSKRRKYSNSKVARVLYIIGTELFQVSLVTYLILLVAETIKPGMVTYFFNLNILLAVVVISGSTMVLTNYNEKQQSLSRIKDWNWESIMQYVHQKEKEEEEKNKEVKIRKWDWYYILGISLGGGLLVNYKTSDLGGISLLITFATMVIICLLSYLIFTEKE